MAAPRRRAARRARSPAAPQVEYRGRTLEEFDLDAALARKPKLIVVDELAHTNAPDSRHPKRWQDVEELLDAGIDVWTALNIQHLESLADVVSRITGVAVRETVPDSVLQEADDVVLVDITPDELIERLNEGKVYLPGDGPAGDAEFLHARQSDRAARTWRCAAPPTASTTRWSTICARRPSTVRGRRPSGCSSASARTTCPNGWCAARAGSPPVSTQTGSP